MIGCDFSCVFKVRKVNFPEGGHIPYVVLENLTVNTERPEDGTDEH